MRSVADSAAPAVEPRHPPRALIRALNPLVRRLVARGVGADQVLVLHYAGRRTGTRYDVPTGYHLLDGVPTSFTNSGWRHNFRGGRDVEVTLRGRRQPARATLVDDPDAVARVYHDLIEQIGWKAAQRRLGIRINVRRTPTVDELRDEARRSGLALVRIGPREQN